ncbi:TonB-dependent siderophore receptor [Polymorphobacter fuscus]|uniref:TonB-dependent siderophore receptor n=1 Tax=Sandarakinorhabdus fusca TaxID=1439888 RepID=A0A7C9GXS0_9SPHN|nr:TonB-dependent siderophore receptor [Polymorphobacter fuscus]KAB7643643.1 TonB-dependent siderophore receptor [Polymorphobacter fuscus]MQT18729.1 TonB-dependent siderophore receptor [Polymorphobacter fuscus]
MGILRHTILSSVAVFALLGAPAAAELLDDETIVVTSKRQAYRGDFTLRETPQAIIEIGPQQIDDNNLTRLADALDLSASVARQNNLGGLWDAYAVRGFAGDENLPSGYLVNGFNGGRGFGGTRDVAGIERIEVLKGPNAALFGRGEPGGTINIVTKRADFDTRGRVNLLAGSFDRQRGDADVNLALGDVAAVRLIGFYEDAGSFRETVRSERFGFLPSVLVKLGGQTSLTYDLELTRQKSDFDRGTIAIDGVLGLIPRERFLGEPGDGPTEADATGHQLQLHHDFSDTWSVMVGTQYRETRLQGFSTDAELVAGRQRLFRDGRSLSRQRRSRLYEGEHFVVRGEVAGRFATGTLTHRVLIGMDYDRFDNSQLFLRFRPPVIGAATTPQASNDIDVFNPVYGRYPLPVPAPQTDRLDRQRAFGAYVQDQISLTDTLQIRIGGRFDDITVDTRNRAANSFAARSYNRFSPQAGLVFAASDAVSLYAAYGEGFRANLGATAAGALFDPETSKSAEIGAKFGVLDNRLQGTVSVFTLSKSNVLAADPANPGFSLPVGKARSRGVELDLNGKLPGAIDLWFSYAYVDAEARADVTDLNFGLAIRAGDPLLNVPKHALNVQLSRAFALGDTRLTLGGGVQHVGARLGETATSFMLPAYTLARVFAAWRVQENVEIFADVSNLFNATYYTNSFAQLWVQPGTPRAASVAARLSF